MTGSLQGDIQLVHGGAYQAMAPIAFPGAVMSEPHVQGGLRVAGGAIETTAGAVGLATTSETGVGAYVSGAAILHGADTVQAGWRQMTSGNSTPSFTQQGITALTGDSRIGVLADSTIGAGLTLGAGLTIESARLGVSGVTVSQVGDYWVKQINPDASALAQWWSRMNLDQQAQDLARLGDMGANFSYENGVLTTQNAGQYAPGNFWSTWWNGTLRLGTPFNDIRPRNIGADGVIFDPSKNIIQQGLEATAVAGTAYAGYQAYQYGNYLFDSNSPTLSKH